MIRDLIEYHLVTCEPDAKVKEAAQTMKTKNVGAVLVMDNGKPRGIITDRDIVVRCVSENIDIDDCTVEQVMTESVDYVKDTDGVFDVIQKMHENKVRRMPVVDQHGKAIGLISFGDLVGMLSKELYALSSTVTPLEDHGGMDVEEKMAA